VFPAPIRPAIEATSRQEANDISRSVDGRGVGAQAWGLYSRVLEVDRILRSDPLARRFIYEVHPEVSFTAWNGGISLAPSKKSAEGLEIRSSLVNENFGKEQRELVRQTHSPGIVTDDDINDVFAALWTAERIYSGIAQVIPDPPQVDSIGIGMGMWY
jgi:predicted RNase H-like nuclease